MKVLKQLTVLLLTLFVTTSLRPMADERAYIDPDLADFTLVEVTEPAETAKNKAAEAKKLILKAQKNLKDIKEIAESEEVSQMMKLTRQLIGSIRKLAFTTGPGFELSNKTQNPIWVTVTSHGKIRTNRKNFNCDKVMPNDRLTLDLKNLNEDMTIAIYLNNPQKVSITKNKENNIEFSPMPNFVYETTEGARGKTKYLSWNPAKYNSPSKYLYPQTGKMGGIAKGTRSGYLLTNNIKSFQLVLTEMQEVEEEEIIETE